jgi:hypothetical protein
MALALPIAEVWLRYSNPLWEVRHPPVCLRPDMFRFSSAFGYNLWPNRRFEYRYPPESPTLTLVHSNSAGFRSTRDFDGADHRPRVVVLGDSMVFGSGVDESSRFTERLEAAMPAWRIDNLGMVGFGPDLMVRALLSAGIEPRPALIVLSIYTDDLRRVVGPYSGVGFALPRYELEAGNLVTIPYPTPNWWEAFHVFQGLRYAYWRYTDATFPLNAALLERFRRVGDTLQAKVAVVFLPRSVDGFDDRLRRRFLADETRRLGVPFLDLTEAVLGGGGSALYLENDSHFNAAGHQLVASELATFLAPLLKELQN